LAVPPANAFGFESSGHTARNTPMKKNKIDAIDISFMRLNKYIAQSGLASRREADNLIVAGKVSINGQIITELGFKIDPAADQVLVGNKLAQIESRREYYAVNKPLGFIVTRKDPHRRPTVMDLIPDLPGNVFPIGRLDSNSEGLLLLTNDGELTHRLLHPRYEIKKIYHVLVKGRPGREQLERLEKGIFLDGRKTAPAKVRFLGGNPSKAALTVEIHEGRKREIRRMFQVLGYPVISLKRIQFAGISLGNLKPGKWRRLSVVEVAGLKKIAGLL
jgi:pseudouridine synthase